MLVVETGENAFDGGLEVDQVDDHARNGVEFAGDSDLQRVVVAVAVGQGAETEDAPVLLLAPVLAVVAMAGGEVEPA